MMANHLSKKRKLMANWSHLPTDLLPEIHNRLELLDFIRFRSVCTSWSSLGCSNNSSCRPKQQIPWLLLSSPKKPHSRFVYSLTEHKHYEIHLPQIAGSQFVGSSANGSLFTLDKFVTQLNVFNPLTGNQFPLPPTTGHTEIDDVIRDPSLGDITHYVSDRDFDNILDLEYMQSYYHKAIISQSTSTVVVIHGGGGPFCDLSFARTGDTSWTRLSCEILYDDIIFHKGHLHAINCEGRLHVFDDLDTSRPSFSADGPLSAESDDESGVRSYLFESPDGESLFFIQRNSNRCDDQEAFQVFKLDKSGYRWSKVDKSMGEFAAFVGSNYAMSFSVRDFPCIKRNTIYFTDGIFSLDDGCIQQFSFGDDFQQQFSFPPPIWFLPSIS